MDKDERQHRENGGAGGGGWKMAAEAGGFHGLMALIFRHFEEEKGTESSHCGANKVPFSKLSDGGIPLIEFGLLLWFRLRFPQHFVCYAHAAHRILNPNGVLTF
jgi:hypothetical protein